MLFLHTEFNSADQLLPYAYDFAPAWLRCRRQYAALHGHELAIFKGSPDPALKATCALRPLAAHPSALRQLPCVVGIVFLTPKLLDQRFAVLQHHIAASKGHVMHPCVLAQHVLLQTAVGPFAARNSSRRMRRSGATSCTLNADCAGLPSTPR